MQSTGTGGSFRTRIYTFTSPSWSLHLNFSRIGRSVYVSQWSASSIFDMREMSCADFPGEHRRPNALRAGDLELHLLVEEHLDRAVPRHEAELEEHAGRRRARRHAGGDRLDDQQLEDVIVAACAREAAMRARARLPSETRRRTTRTAPARHAAAQRARRATSSKGTHGVTHCGRRCDARRDF